MDEKALREKIANEIRSTLIMAMENCACLGRDAYGQYIDNMTEGIVNEIKKTK